MNTQDIGQNSEGREHKFEGDKLDQIFSAQKKLMQNYKKIAEEDLKKKFGVEVSIPEDVWNGMTANLHTKSGNHFIVEMINAAIHELSEAVQTMKNWKSWKQTEVPSDVDHFKEEMIDSLHFFVEALLLCGVTADEVYDLYFKKNKVNQFRQESNY